MRYILRDAFGQLRLHATFLKELIYEGTSLIMDKMLNNTKGPLQIMELLNLKYSGHISES